MSTEPVINNTDRWIEENKKFFLPPVCNKMMHQDGQMKSFYVGGPNQRKDYHIEEGEELFYMVKGDMCLKVMEKGVFKDVPIREGEIFLLPGSIAHSPQRQADTVGLVIERERSDDEKDGLRYHVEQDGKPTPNSLFEKWFHCEDLGSQLGPIIKEFFASEQAKTGKPVPGTIPEKPPVTLNPTLTLQDPFSLDGWIKDNREEIDSQGCKKMFVRDDYVHQFQYCKQCKSRVEGFYRNTPIRIYTVCKDNCEEIDCQGCMKKFVKDDYVHQFQVGMVYVHGKGQNKGKTDVAETFIWVLEGSSTVVTGGKEYTMGKGDNMLIRQGQEYTASRPEGSISLICWQDPTLKKKVEL